MKNLNVISILLGALIGVATTILITKYFFPEKNYSAFPGKEMKFEEIDSAKADILKKEYEEAVLKNPIDTCKYKLAINVSKEQYELIRQRIRLMTTQELAAISGFRLYFAYLPPDNSLVSIIYRIDNSFNQVPENGNPLLSNPYNIIYAQECPPFCNRANPE